MSSLLLTPNTNTDIIITKNQNYSSFIFKPTITVKLISNFKNSTELIQYWNKMLKTPFNWNNLRFVYDKDTKADYYIIVNKPSFDEYYEKSKTIVFRMEPDCETNPYFNDFYSFKDEFLYFCSLDKFHNNGEWWLNMNYNQLINSIGNISKNNSSTTLSTIVSSKYTDPGHKFRIDFLKYLEEKKNFSIDIYGVDNFHKFKNYVKPLNDKKDGLFPYKYTLVVENTKKENYLTEKLIDAILSETLPIYWGCPNVFDFFSEKSIIYLESNDFEKCYQIINNAIKNDEWSKRIDFIRQDKMRILKMYSFAPRTESLINFSRLDKYLMVNNEDDCKCWKDINQLNFIDKDIITFPLNDKSKWRIPKNVLKCDNKDYLVLSSDYKRDKHFIDRIATIYNTIQYTDWDIVVINEMRGEKDNKCFSDFKLMSNIDFDIDNYLLNELSIQKILMILSGKGNSLKIYNCC
jgi:hypothetical protein